MKRSMEAANLLIFVRGELVKNPTQDVSLYEDANSFYQFSSLRMESFLQLVDSLK